MSRYLFGRTEVRPVSDAVRHEQELTAARVEAGQWRWTAERLAAAMLADGDTASVYQQRRAALAAFDRMQEGSPK